MLPCSAMPHTMVRTPPQRPMASPFALLASAMTASVTKDNSDSDAAAAFLLMTPMSPSMRPASASAAAAASFPAASTERVLNAARMTFISGGATLADAWMTSQTTEMAPALARLSAWSLSGHMEDSTAHPLRAVLLAGSLAIARSSAVTNSWSA